MTTNVDPKVIEPPSVNSSSTPGSATAHRPQLWVMWLNAALSWSILAFVYLVYLTVRNISWARRNSLPWLRYFAPILTVILVTTTMVLIGAMSMASQSSKTTFTSPSGTGVLTGAQGKVAHPAPTPTVTVITADSPLGDRLSIADGLPGHTPMHATPSDNIADILADFKIAWRSAAQGIDGKQAPQYFWGFVYDTQGPFYNKWSHGSMIVMGDFWLTDVSVATNDVQSARKATDRTYNVTLDHFSQIPQELSLTLRIKLINATQGVNYSHWMLMSLN